MDINFNILSDYDKNIIENKYEEIIKNIEFILIDSSSCLKFFGHFFMCLNKKITFLDDQDIWKKMNGVEMGVVFIEDDTLNYIVDPEVIHDEYATFKLLYKTLHALLHSILMHQSRKPSDIKDAVIFNLAADHVVNCVIKSLFDNAHITKMAYFSDKEFFVQRLFDKKENESVENIHNYIVQSDEFEVNAKRITIPMIPAQILSQLTGGANLPKIKVESIISKDDIKYQTELQIKNLQYKLNSFDDPEFNITNLNESNESVDDEDLYLSKKYNSFFTKSDDIKNFDENDSEYIEDSISFDINKILDDSKNDENLPSLIEDDEQEQNVNNSIPIMSFIIIHVYDKVTKKSYQVIYDLENDSSGSDSIEQNAPIQYEKYKENLRQASGKDPGDTSFDGLSILDDLFDIDYPWDYILDNAIKTKSQKTDDRSFVEYDIYRNHLPGLRFPGYVKHMVPEILCAAIDTSGSMSDEDLKHALSMLCDSYGKFDEIVVLMHDIELKKEIYITDISNPEQIFEQVSKFRGRGGTSHRYVFDRLEELSQEKILSVVIFFTDYYSDVKEIHKNYEFLRYNETIWCINGQDRDFVVNLTVPTYTIHIDKLGKK